jgi:PAS domain S-box-containing protein
MATVVPDSGREGTPDDRAHALATILDSLLGFTGATVGWIGLLDARGRLTFPVRRGDFPDAWLTLQQARGDVWGFAVRDGPTLLNDLPPLPTGMPAALHNLLSCPIGTEGRGQVVLANKPNGFTSYDAAVLQGFAHLLAVWVGPPHGPAAGAIELPPPWQRVLDQAGVGIVILDEAGTLLYANATWLDWTGFAAEEVVGQSAPFPFWVSHRELAQLGSQAAGHGRETMPQRGETMPQQGIARPFRRRDGSHFWCTVRTCVEQWEGRRLTIAYLYGPVRDEAPPTSGPGQGQETMPQGQATFSALLKDLPFGVVLTDHLGHVLWSNPALDRLAPGAGQGALLRDCFLAPSTASLDRLLRDAGQMAAGQMGRLILQRPAGPLSALWLQVSLAGGPGFLFALTDDPDGFPLATEGETAFHKGYALPSPDWLTLLLRPAGEVAYWNERWEKLTGLSVPKDTRSELVLDWLFPRQRDRETVADWFHGPSRRGGQAVLDLVTPTGSRPMLCTLLPVSMPEPVAANGEGAGRAGEDWLLLVGEPDLFVGDGGLSSGLMRQFARGLGVLLNQYLTVPIGLAEEALSRPDLSAPVGAWFQQILDSCQKSSRLIAALEDLSAVSPGETQRVPLAALVGEALEELPPAAERHFQLRVEVRDAEVPVRVNRRMLRTVLRHLLSNAVQALAGSDRRQIEVRVYADGETARCEIHDTGEGFPAEDWLRSPAPFHSTKGPFARDPAHAALEATGLGLTVCRHLLMLHQGRLELTSPPGMGTTAALILPRADTATAEANSVRGGEVVRADAAAPPHGPHQSAGRPARREPPNEH